MSVIIEDMIMPECCMKCPMKAGYGCGYMGVAMATKDMQSGRHEDCPLVEVEDDARGHAMSAINREDALEAILSKLAEREEPYPPWIYATIRKCLDDLPGLPTTEPLVHDGYYLCDKKPGACPSWERKGWTKCESKHCNRTSRVDHALKLPDADDGWIPVEDRLPDNNTDFLLQFKSNMGVGFYEDGDWTINTGDGIYSLVGYNEEKPIAWRELPKPYKPKEEK